MRTALNIFIAMLTLGTLLGFAPKQAFADTITVEVRSIVASTSSRTSSCWGRATRGAIRAA